jgi:hypothetical protein
MLAGLLASPTLWSVRQASAESQLADDGCGDDFGGLGRDDKGLAFIAVFREAFAEFSVFGSLFEAKASGQLARDHGCRCGLDI